jgi:hypothetical protein
VAYYGEGSSEQTQRQLLDVRQYDRRTSPAPPQCPIHASVQSCSVVSQLGHSPIELTTQLDGVGVGVAVGVRVAVDVAVGVAVAVAVDVAVAAAVGVSVGVGRETCGPISQ